MILQIFRQWWVGGSGKVSECCQHVSNLLLTSAVITGSEALPVRFYRLMLYIILGVKYCSPIFLLPVRFSFGKRKDRSYRHYIVCSMSHFHSFLLAIILANEETSRIFTPYFRLNKAIIVTSPKTLSENTKI